MTALFTSNPVLPWWVILASGLLYGWLAWLTYSQCKLTTRQKGILWAIRMLAFLLLAWMLLLQSLRTSRKETEKPAVAILVDGSASMTDNPIGAEKTRAQRAAELLSSSPFRSLSSKARLFTFGIGAEIGEAPTEATFTAPRSLISQHIAQVASRFRGDRLAAMVLLSDGLDQSPETLEASTLGVPLYIPELEEPGEPIHKPQLDFGIGETSYPKRVTVNWKTSITAAIRRLSGTQAASFAVKLLQEGTVIQEDQVSFAEKESTRRVTFQLEPAVLGSQIYELRIEPGEDESAANNRKELLIEVTDNKQRILYLEGTPRWEFKFLKRSLLAEQNLQLHAFVRFGDGSFISFDETSSGDPMPPLTHEALKEYKAVIIGDLPATAISEAEAAELCRFVEDGGALLMLGGVNAYKEEGLAFARGLAPIMPAGHQAGSSMREGRFSVDFTAEGRVLPAFSSLAETGSFPPILTLWGPVKPGPFTSTYLAATDGSPLLLARQAGQGRTAMLLSDSLWRWQMGGNDGEGSKGLYARFITQLLYWLCPDKQEGAPDAPLQLLLAAGEVDQHAKVVIGAIGNLPSGSVTCTITTPSGKSLALPMPAARLENEVGLSQPQNGFKCEFSPDEIGTYKLEARSSDGSRHASTLLLSRFPELEHTGAPINRAFLHALAENSGGKWVTWSRHDNLLEGLELAPRAIEIVQTRPIWNHWLGLALLLALYCLEWWLRRHWELV